MKSTAQKSLQGKSISHPGCNYVKEVKKYYRGNSGDFKYFFLTQAEQSISHLTTS